MARLILRRPGEQAATPGGPGVISVVSGKGGVGKSVLSFNLAHALAANGDRILLVDADLAGGNIHVLANLVTHQGIVEYQRKAVSLTNLVVHHSDNLDILASPPSGGVPEQLQPSAPALLVRRLKSDAVGYDGIVIDHPSGRSADAVSWAVDSDVNLLVVVPELTSVSDAYGLYKHLLQQQPGVDCRIVVNRVGSAEEADDLMRKLSEITGRFLGQVPRCAGYVCEDPLVRRSVAAQSPLARLAPQSSAWQSLTAFGRTLLLGGITSSALSESDDSKAINQNPAVADTRE